VSNPTATGHNLPGPNVSQPTLPAVNFGQAYFDFLIPSVGSLPSDGNRTVTASSSFDTASQAGNTNNVGGSFGGATILNNTFRIPAPDTNARSGSVMLARFPGSYSCTGRAGIITIDTSYGGAGTFGTMADHGLSVGDQVFLNFTGSRDTTSGAPTSTENDLVYSVITVPDQNSFTVAARDAANAAISTDNSVTVFPLKTQPLTRNGTIVARQGTFNLDNTDFDLQQTPLNSPTVFNYFVPDYKFSGVLANNGLTTPEFELTSETTVLRQANFIYNGLFNPGNLTGISSFRSGTNALVLDFTRWMGTAVNDVGSIGHILGNGTLGSGQQIGQVWTSNANVGTLIDRLNTLLLGGNLPAAVKTEILKFIGGQISSITQASPCTITMGAAHGLVVGNTVAISGISGGTFSGAPPTGLGGPYTVLSVPTPNSVTLTNFNCTSTTVPSVLNLANSTLAPSTNLSNFPIYVNSSPSAQNIRDRLRAIIHFILTSPDYTIQR